MSRLTRQWGLAKILIRGCLSFDGHVWSQARDDPGRRTLMSCRAKMVFEGKAGEAYTRLASVARGIGPDLPWVLVGATAAKMRIAFGRMGHCTAWA